MKKQMKKSNAGKIKLAQEETEVLAGTRRPLGRAGRRDELPHPDSVRSGVVHRLRAPCSAHQVARAA